MTEDELFLSAILSCSRSELYTRPVVLTPEQRQLLDQMHARREAGEPVQYICGFTEFLGHRIEVGPGVLIPRPETEVLADTVITALKARGDEPYYALDVGTGSACLPIALTKALPNARVLGLDVSSEALAYARRNIAANGVADRVELVERDMFWFMDETPHRFDVVVSNPPYIPTFMMGTFPADVGREPALALDGGPDGLHYYRYIIPMAKACLKCNGIIALEFGDGQRKELENLFLIIGGWDKIQVIKDNTGRNRIIMAYKVS